MTSRSINIETLLRRLTSESTSYYIEQKEIATRSQTDGHILYSRYKKFEGTATATLIKQHISKDISLAIPLNKNNFLFEYSGEHTLAFASLLFYIAKEFSINTLLITSYSFSGISIYLGTSEYNSNTIGDFIEKVTRVLKEKLPNEWQLLPRKNIPEIGNLLKLPREIIPFNSI